MIKALQILQGKALQILQGLLSKNIIVYVEKQYWGELEILRVNFCI